MHKLALSIILIPFLLNSCLDIETLTIINQDGSLERHVGLTGDPGEIQTTGFNVPREDIEFWEQTTDSIEKDKASLKASRHFASIDEMNQSFRVNGGPLRVQIEAELKLLKRLFFTRYRYMEKIWADLPGPELPMDDYLCMEDIEALLLRDSHPEESLLDSVEAKRLERAFESYLDHKIFEDFLLELDAGVRAAGISRELMQPVQDNYDSLFSQLRKTNFQNDNQVWQQTLAIYIDTTTIQGIHKNNADGFRQFYKRWQFFEEMIMNGYTFNIELPGSILETNSINVVGNRLSWKPEAVLLFLGGVELNAESSKINPRAIILAGALVFLILLVTLLRFFRKAEKGPD
ncbi:hypothetical protein HQ531_05880 [bacterium]|nr:hypothetical protein [bacterium]